MTRQNHSPTSLLKSLKVVGYFGLCAIAIALFIAMCAILRNITLDREAAHGPRNDSVEMHGSADADGGLSAQAGQTKTPG